MSWSPEGQRYGAHLKLKNPHRKPDGGAAPIRNMYVSESLFVGKQPLYWSAEDPIEETTIEDSLFAVQGERVLDWPEGIRTQGVQWLRLQENSETAAEIRRRVVEEKLWPVERYDSLTARVTADAGPQWWPHAEHPATRPLSQFAADLRRPQPSGPDTFTQRGG